MSKRRARANPCGEHWDKVLDLTILNPKEHRSRKHLYRIQMGSGLANLVYVWADAQHKAVSEAMQYVEWARIWDTVDHYGDWKVKRITEPFIVKEIGCRSAVEAEIPF